MIQQAKDLMPGDVAEGIFAAGLTARFRQKDNKIDVLDIVKVIEELTRIGDQNSRFTTVSHNANPTVKDNIELYINLAKTNLDALFLKRLEKLSSMAPIFDATAHFCNSENCLTKSKMLYENNISNTIKIVSDGIGNQKGTKLDVSVMVSDKTKRLHEFDINVSLKAGDVKQFGQIGGSEFIKQVKLWGMFGINLQNQNIENKYNLLLGTNAKKAIEYSYDLSSSEWNKISPKEKSELLKKAIITNMIGEEDIILVQLNKTSSVYNPKNLDFGDEQIISQMRLSSLSKNPEVVFLQGKKHILTIRTKIERNSYFRNYIEKGNDLHSFIVH